MSLADGLGALPIAHGATFSRKITGLLSGRLGDEQPRPHHLFVEDEDNGEAAGGRFLSNQTGRSEWGWTHFNGYLSNSSVSGEGVGGRFTHMVFPNPRC